MNATSIANAYQAATSGVGQQANAKRDTVISQISDMSDTIARLWKAADFARMHADAIAGPEQPSACDGNMAPVEPQGIVEAISMKVGELNRLAFEIEHHQSRVARALG